MYQGLCLGPSKTPLEVILDRDPYSSKTRICRARTGKMGTNWGTYVCVTRTGNAQKMCHSVSNWAPEARVGLGRQQKLE